MTVFKKYPGPGIANVGSYQMGGIPFASSSIVVPPAPTPVSVEFPWVTKFVTVINANSGTNAPLRVGFSEHGVKNTSNVGFDTPHANNRGEPMGNNYWFVLNNGESYTGEWRIGELWLMGHYEVLRGTTAPHWTTASVLAGLTGIQTKEIPAISGNMGVSFGDEGIFETAGNWSGSIGVG